MRAAASATHALRRAPRGATPHCLSKSPLRRRTPGYPFGAPPQLDDRGVARGRRRTVSPVRDEKVAAADSEPGAVARGMKAVLRVRPKHEVFAIARDVAQRPVLALDECPDGVEAEVAATAVQVDALAVSVR